MILKHRLRQIASPIKLLKSALRLLRRPSKVNPSLKPEHKAAETQILWNVLKKLNLKFNDDLLTSIDSDDIVEVYNLNRIQVYRNKRFLEVFSHDLIDLFTLNRSQLFSREPFFNKQINNVESLAFECPLPKHFSLTHIKPHVVGNLCKPSENVLLSPKFVYSLINKSAQTEYVVMVSKGEILNKNLAYTIAED